MPPIAVVLNPRARKNRRAFAGRAERLRRAVGALGTVVVTRSVEELRAALGDVYPGATHLVSDGGDGALHWMINEVSALRGDAPWPTFVPTRGGTIDFVAHKVGIRGRPEEIVERLVAGLAAGREPRVVRLDSLAIEGERRLDGRDRPFSRHGFAVAAGGVGQRFFDKYYSDPEPTPATIARIVARTLASFAAARLPGPGGGGAYAREVFAPTRARVTVDGAELPYREHGAIHAGAFDLNLGGLIKVFPLAREPGVVQLQAGVIAPAQIIRNLPNLARGRAVVADRLHDGPGAHMRVEALGDELLAPIIDGEAYAGVTWLEIRPGPPIPIGVPS